MVTIWYVILLSVMNPRIELVIAQRHRLEPSPGWMIIGEWARVRIGALVHSRWSTEPYWDMELLLSLSIRESR